MKTTVGEIKKLYKDNMLLPSMQGIKTIFLTDFDHYEDSFEISFGHREGFLQSSVAEVLVHLPPELVYERLGLDAAAWAFLNTAICTLAYEDYMAFVSETIGKPKDTVASARSVTVHHGEYDHDAKTFLRNCMLLDEMENGLAGLVDLETLLRASAKPGVSISGRRVRDYSLDFIRPNRLTALYPNLEAYGFEERWGCFDENGRRYEIYMDGPIGFALMYKGRPNAITSFATVNPDTLKIMQLQGVNPAIIDKYGIRMKETASARGLMPFEWERLLVGIVMDAATMLNYRRICVKSGHNNTWVASDAHADGKMTLERALGRYDKVAESMGFSQGADKDWYLDITA